MRRGTRSRRGRRMAASRRRRGRTQPALPRSFGHNLEDAALDEERIIVQVMLDPAHLDDAEIASHRGAHADIDLAQAQVDNRVREEFLDAEVGEGGRVPRHLRDEEGRRVQVPQLLEELENLVPRALEGREGVQRIEAVERDQVAPHLLFVPRELATQAQEPPGLLADLLDLAPQRAHVDDVDALRIPRIHAERGHLRNEGRAALLHRQVQARGPVLLRLVEEDAVDERRFQGARRSRHQDDVSARDSTAQTIVQADDIRRNLVCGLGQYGTPSRPDRRYRAKASSGGNGIARGLRPPYWVADLEAGDRDREAHLRISDRAHVVMPYHKIIDGLEEKLKGNLGAGTTLRGIGPSFEDKVGRFGIRMCDLVDPVALREKLETMVPIKQRLIDAYGGTERLDLETIYKEQVEYGARLAPFVADTSVWLDAAIRRRKRVLFEGAQGTHLCIDHGIYPFGTSSDCVAGAASVGAGVGPQFLTDIVGVAKAFTSRVGTGPFPTEVEGATAEYLRERGGGEYGTTTRRPRRVGWLDLVMLRIAVRVNGLTSLAVTKVDVLGGPRRVPVGGSYRHNTGTIKEFPASMRVLSRCEPVYREFKGWADLTESQWIATAKKGKRALPEAVRKYLGFIEAQLKVPVRIISVGRPRAATIGQ